MQTNELAMPQGAKNCQCTFSGRMKTKNGKKRPGMVIVFFLLLASAINSIAQNDSPNRMTPFDTGIRLENVGVLIPWGIKTSNLTEIGNPKIDTLAKKVLNVLWDSVKICGGVKGSIKYNPREKKHADYTRLFYLYALVDNGNCEKVVQYCNENIYTAPEYRKFRGKFPQYTWRTTKILVQITKGRYFTLMYIARNNNTIKITKP